MHEAGTRAAVGLALGGGAARGVAHVGALKALEAEGVAVAGVAGTSYGAVIAALFALGSPALEIERVVRTQDLAELWRQAFDFGLHEGGLVRGRRLSRWLDRKFFMGATFDDVRVPLAIACTDLATGRLRVVRSGSIADAVRASCALPGVFAPVRLGEEVLIDGGLVETVPFRALATLDVPLMVGVHAGVDVSRSRFVTALRRLAASRGGRAYYRRTGELGVAGTVRQLARGLAISARSYSRPVRAPRGAYVVSVDPGVAWWDFHRSPQSIAAGEAAVTALLRRMRLEGALPVRSTEPRQRGADAAANAAASS
ncbi:MAG TPA: patatin-like phospholipase family protein [Trueperaceae bacterium]|nr:patatin-like phospholipase family protein [Trueperaceae bacterium]